MASRQGGSFNSILGKRKSPLASLSSKQQRARGSNLRGKKYTIINASRLTFLVLGCPTAPGSLCLWETLFCLEDARLLFLFFAISSVRSSRPRPSRTPTALLLNPTTQPNLLRRRGRKRRSHVWLTLPWANRNIKMALRSAFPCLLFTGFNVGFCDNKSARFSAHIHSWGVASWLSYAYSVNKAFWQWKEMYILPFEKCLYVFFNQPTKGYRNSLKLYIYMNSVKLK